MAPNIFELLAKISVKPVHSSLVADRRVDILTNHLLTFLPEMVPLRGLDIGCGPGTVASKMQHQRKDLRFIGIDTLSRPSCAIEMIQYDGQAIPFPDKYFQFAMLIDVLHHTEDPEKVLAEAIRVSQQFILIKDHICNSVLDKYLLRFMDWIGNRAHGVSLPYNYLSDEQWQFLYHKVGVKSQQRLSRLNLYPIPFTFLFDGHLHFISKLSIPNL